MIVPFLRAVWRLVVLALGIGLAYVVAFIAFPYLDRRLPLFIVVVVLYVGLAYFLLPTLMRTWRLLIRPNHIPLYTTTRDGIPSDPVNIAVVARSRKHFIKTMQQAGWYQADKANLRTALREAYAIIFDKSYPTAPFSSLYLFNHSQDVGFQIPYGQNGSPRQRHHIRFWQLTDNKDRHGHSSFWRRRFRQFLGKEKTIWIGAALDDINAYGIRWYNLQITHNTHPLHHQERDFVIKTLQDIGKVKSVTGIKAGEPFKMRSQQLGGRFVSDGKLQVVELQR